MRLDIVLFSLIGVVWAIFVIRKRKREHTEWSNAMELMVYFWLITGSIGLAGSILLYIVEHFL